MSYYDFNRKVILQKAKERKKLLKSQKKWYKILSEEEKDKIKEYQSKIYQEMIQHKKEALQNKWVLFLLSIRMSEKTPKFDNIRVNNKEFLKSKQPINLNLINVDQIVVSDKFKHSDGGFKYFIGYKEGEILKLLCNILPQMSGYIKYF